MSARLRTFYSKQDRDAVLPMGQVSLWLSGKEEGARGHQMKEQKTDKGELCWVSFQALPKKQTLKRRVHRLEMSPESWRNRSESQRKDTELSTIPTYKSSS